MWWSFLSVRCVCVHFLCCKASCHKCRDFTHIYYFAVFMDQTLGMASQAAPSPRLQSWCRAEGWRCMFPSGAHNLVPGSRVIGRIQLLMVVGLNSLFS